MICQPIKSMPYVTNNSTSNIYIIHAEMYTCMHECFMYVHVQIFILPTRLLLGKYFCQFVF